MNTLNRLLTVLLLITMMAFAILLCLSLINFGWINGSLLHLPGHPQTLAAAFTSVGQGVEQRTTQWEGTGVAITIACLLLLGMEVQSARGEKRMVLHRDASGTTALDISALCDLVRWAAENTEGVEGMPVTRVKRHGKTLVVTGVTLLNPYVNARNVVPTLQQNVQTAVCRASGFPVLVRLRSRFQDPRVRRKPR